MAEGVIGSVGVEVTPDARRFWQTFKANTEAQARDAGDDLGRKLGVPMGDKAGVEARTRIDAALKNIKANVDVDADTKKAQTKISTLKLLIGSLAPGAIPLGAFGAAALGAASLGAASLLLGVKGISNEMKAGTAVGKQYSTGVATLKTYFGQLERTAATNLLGPFNEGVKDAGGLFPSLNKEVGEFAQIAGKDAALALHGLIGGFKTLEPLFLEMGLDSEHLFTKFDKFANGNGLQKFVDYAQRTLPQVESTLSAVGSAVVHLIQGLEPLGGLALTELKLFADIVNSLSPDEIQAIAGGVLAWAVATKALALAQKGANAVGVGAGVGGASRLAGWVGVGVVIDQIAAKALHTTPIVQRLEDTISRAASGDYSGAFSALTGGYTGSLPGSGDPDVPRAPGITKKAAEDIYSPEYKALFEQNYGDVAKAAGAQSALTQATQAYNLTISKTANLSDYSQQLSSTSDATQKLLDNTSALTAHNTDKTKDLGGGLVVDVTAWNLALHETNNNADKAETLIRQALSENPQYAKTLTDLQAKQAAYNTEVANSAAALGISADDLSKYAGYLGITGTQLVSGAVSQQQLTAHVQAFLNITKTAGPAMQGLLTAMDAYGKSSGTAADKTQLLGAVLKQSQGDALSYSAAIAGGYSATASLISTFQQQAADSVGSAGTVDPNAVASARGKVTASTARLTAAESKLADLRAHQKSGSKVASAEAAVASARSATASATERLNKAGQPSGGKTAAIAFADTEKAAINLKTGLINLKAAGAGPLIQQLQGMQDAAVGAAQAVYQHEVATKGDTVALQDAQTIFQSMTGGALVQNAKQLGLTKDQAKRLADQYLTISDKTLTSKVQAIGLDTINTTLTRIGQLLATITGQSWDVKVGVHVAGEDGLVPIAYQTTPGGGKKPQRALGGMIYGPGTGTSDSVPIMASVGEHVDTAASTRRNLNALTAGNRGATLTAHFAAGGVVGGAPAMSPAFPGGPIVVVVELDGREIARSTNEVNLYNRTRR